MKQFILFLLLVNFSFSQTVKHDNLTEGKFNEYITKNNHSIKVGDKINLGYPSLGNKFTYIIQGNDLVDARLNNIEIVVDKIIIQKLQNGSLKPYFTFKGFGIPIYVDIEAAIYFKEIIIQ